MNQQMRLLGWLTLWGFGLAGLALVYFFQETSVWALLAGHGPLWIQVLIGLLAGLISGFFARWLILRSFFEKEKIKYRNLINQWSWTPAGIVFISFCAGIGEELFFRAGLQPLLGLWTTTVLFVLLHGYLNPFNWRISVYGILMVGLIAFFGYLFQQVGILTSILAHAAFDAVLLFWLTGGDGGTGRLRDEEMMRHKPSPRNL
ncbi:CPBP family intramembrane glutamic endopeptidase [Cyclobacterium roseum]|uniref:CPBP family intramembrane glutamic endopeptidase n=1 Tax=Cyclobacterium roseum TaxID=2666137 RepID=UPI001391799C|nr:CPBP family intramembrane glutamic endopeptidase [Cyclobacterium roseum]